MEPVSKLERSKLFGLAGIFSGVDEGNSESDTANPVGAKDAALSMAGILRHNHQTQVSRANIPDMRLFFFIIAISLTTARSFADTILLTNGDRITGDIEQLDETNLRVKTAYAASINIQRSAIQSFSTDEPKTWLHQSQSRSISIALSDAPGYVQINSLTVPIAELSLTQEEAAPKWRKDGQIGTTLDVDTGTNQGRKEFHLNAELNLESKNWRHNFKNETNHDKEEDLTTEDTAEFRYALDYFFDDHWLLRSENVYREDNLPPDNQYTLTGAGPGYRLWGERRNRLDIIATYNHLWFSSDYVDQEFSGWAITLDYMQFWFNDKLETFADAQWIYPDIDSVDPIFDMDIGLRYLLTSRIFLTLRYDYNETQSEQEKVVDSGYVLGGGVNF